MKASLGLTVWTLVVFSCLFKISQAQCPGQPCNSSVSFNTTTTTITAQSCNLSLSGSDESSAISDLQPGTVHTVFAHCSNCCFQATTIPAKPVNITASYIGTYDLNINWTLPEGKADHFVVQLDQRENQTAASWLHFTGLSPGRLHKVSVTAVAGHLNNTSEPSEFATRPLRPTSITVNDRTNSSLDLSWDVDPQMQSAVNINYDVTYEEGGFARKTSDTNITLTSLKSGTQYEITVTAVGPQDLRSDGFNVSACTNPNPVLNIIANPESNTSVKVEWSYPLDNKQNYSYMILTYNASGNVIKNETVPENYASVTDLEPGTRYKITVTTVVTSECWSEEEEVFVYTKPNPVSNLQVQVVNSTTVTLTWDSADYVPAPTYLVQAQQGPKVVHSDSVSTPKYTFTNLTPGEVHTFTVITEVEGVQSDEETTTQQMRPAAVTITKITGGTTYLNVSWSAAVGKVDTYSAILYNHTDQVKMKSDLSSSTLDVSFTDLTPGVEYCAVVVTKSGDQMDNSSRVCNSTLPAAVNITEITGGTTHLTVSWSEADGKVDTYSVLLYNGTEQVDNKTDLSNSTLYASFTNLTPGVEYCAEVITKSGDLMNSARLCNSTMPATVTITKIIGGTTHLNVSWSEAEGNVDTYSVLLHNGIVQVGNKSDLSNDTLDAFFTDLKPGVEYCAEVITRSRGLENKSVPSCNATFPNPPRNLRLTSRTERSLTFSWDPPEDMQPHQYNFSVTNYTGITGPQPPTVSHISLDDLESGSLYNISVVTVGVYGYESQKVDIEAYTMPYPVSKLKETQITPTSVTLEWNQTEYKPDYVYSVEVSDVFRIVNSTNVTTFTHKVEGLFSGTSYNFTVTARAADGTPATPRTVSYFTRPYAIRNLTAVTINTTSVNLTWEQPAEYKEQYTYSVETTGCKNSINHTNKEELLEMSGLTPGTNCSFCVTVRAENGIEGESVCTFQYTEPETAHPLVLNQGSNSSLLVLWQKPLGNVEQYTVYLNGSNVDKNVTLNSSGWHYTFEKLPPGRLYTVVVETQSGPFNATSKAVNNATIPTSPGAIELESQTTSSINVSWGEAPLMSGAEFFYRLEISSPAVNTTTHTNYQFTQLQSGTPYNISVTTVAAMSFQSEAKWRNMVFTKPLNVTALQTDPSEESVTLIWTKPEDYKPTYRFNVTVTMQNSTGKPRSNITKDFKHTFSKLDPGTSYNFSVTTETSDGTQGAPKETSICTTASPVEFKECLAPNELNATITWIWNKPKGGSSSFAVKLQHSQEKASSLSCKFKESDLKHFTNYTVEVATQSCGKPSSVRTKTCQTGITAPPIPDDYQSLRSVVGEKFNRFTIEIKRRMLDSTNGPIRNVGVLVAKGSDSVDSSKIKQYLGTDYSQWKDEKTGAYLATVVSPEDLGENPRTRSTQETLIIHIGDETTWKGYYNGFLEPITEYKFAIVLFTDLTTKGELINGDESLFTATEFNNYAITVQNPVVIYLAVGLTLAIFFILLLLLIGAIIYWRRLSNKDHSDINVNSMRVKVSAPVRVEDYEVYYKKQKADSNCGFAKEYEDLKVVGTGQSKTNALNPENKPKNRYNNVLPYDSSRIKLSIIHGNPIDDYINANYIPGYSSRKEFIAAQGPLPTTVNDFWRMIWEKNVHTMVMLTRCNEQGRVKCEQYWTLGTKHFGNITVTTTSEIPLDDWTIRDFDIKNVKTAETRSVRHFHFTAWPDHGVPETTELLISFRHLVREHMDQYRHSPTVVHCSAGVGRTGTFIAIDRLLFQIERENVVDVYGIVHDMRMHRTLMVQTEDQYVFLNQCALDIIRSRTGTNVDLIYQNTSALAIYENIELHRRES